MNDPVRVGVLSTAWIASLVVPLIDDCTTVDVAAVASRSLEGAEIFASAAGITRAYGTYEELLGDPNIDAVYIAVPNSLHAHWVETALKAGKHVLCEKPLTPTASEAEALFALAKKQDRELHEGFMYRHHPQTTTAVDLLNRGAIGKPTTIDCWFHTRVADPTINVRYRPDLAGGALFDVGSYCTSFANLVTQQEPVALCGVARMAASGVDEAFSAVMEYGSGVAATFDSSMDSLLSTGVRIVGSDATMTIANPWLPDINAPIWGGPMPASEVVVSKGTESEHFPCTSHNPYWHEFDNFAAAIRGDANLRIEADETVANLRTIERLLDSVRDREPVAPVGG